MDILNQNKENEVISQEPKQINSNELLDNIQQIDKEKITIVYISYLSTLARLWENRDLSNLFDWEINLWEEELFTIYSLIEIINWTHDFKLLQPPKKMQLDVDWWQDYIYELWYQELESWVKRLKEVKADWSLPMNETKLILDYKNDKISELIFKRPANLQWIWLDQKIQIVREWNLVKKFNVLSDFAIDNNISIKYNQLNKPEVVEKTQLDVLSDKIVFEYDEQWNLVSIIYVPSLSLKHLKWTAKSFNRWRNIKNALKWIELAWQFVAFNVLKKTKWVDVIEINNENHLPKSTQSNLDASNWFYTKWFSQMKYNTKWQMQELYMEMEDIWPDDKKTLKIEY